MLLAPSWPVADTLLGTIALAAAVGAAVGTAVLIADRGLRRALAAVAS